MSSVSQSPSILEMARRAQDISRKLRMERLLRAGKKWKRDWTPGVPDIFYGQSPTGQKCHPIVAFKTPLCDRYLAGSCIPCGYSGRFFPTGAGPDERRGWLISQLDWLCFNLEKVLKVSGGLSKEAPLVIQLAGASSFFRDEEIGPDMRETILSRILQKVQALGIKLQVVLETRPEHFVQAEDSGELSHLASLLAELQVAVNFGYEFCDHFLREIVFQKGISDEVFFQAINIAKRRKMDPGAFVFAGGYLLAPPEALAETGKTLRVFQEMGIFPNLMVPNLQAFTLPDLLYEFDFYCLPEPYFVLDLLDLLYDFLPDRKGGITTFNWFLGGIEAEPPPRINIFNNPRMQTSKDVAEEISSCVYDLMKSHDWDGYEDESFRLRGKKDYKYYAEDMGHKSSLNYKYRMIMALELATSKYEEYCRRMSHSL